jgi:actin related protein 2/3 complex subunit 1A/1B
VHSAAFSPSGNTIAYVSHDSCIYIANGPEHPVQRVVTGCLPFVSLAFANENSLIVAGHDCCPYSVNFNGSAWYCLVM